MSEKEPQIIGQAISIVGQEHKDDIADARAAQRLKVVGENSDTRGKRSYSYDGGNYFESYQHEGDQYSDSKDTVATEAASGDDAALQREASRRHDYDGVYESTDTLVKAKVAIPTSEGSAAYSAETHTHQGRERGSVDKSSATIVRTDADGNEVYRFTSDSRKLTDKIGQVAAGRLIRSVNRDQLDRVA